VIVGSLFSGCGGFDLGLENAGMTIAWQAEILPRPCSVLRRHWPEVPNHGDVTEIDCGSVQRVDLLCGGFPCQDISVAGSRAGLAGKRSGLFFEFVRLAGEISPEWLLLENVDGLLSCNGGADLAVVLHALVQLGYRVAWRVLDTQHFGCPQRRRRVFLVGHSRAECAAAVLLEPDGVRGDSPASRAAGEDVAAGAVPCIAAGGGPVAGGIGRIAHPILGSGDASDRGDGASNLIVADPLNGLNDGGTYCHAGNTPRPRNVVLSRCVTTGERFDSETETFVVAYDERNVTSKTNRSNPKPGDPCHTLHADNGSIVVPIGEPGDPSPTLAASHPPPVSINGLAPRRLTPREKERLQGFPDDWTRFAADGNEIADGPRGDMLGNAVSVPVAEWIGRRIMEADAALKRNTPQ
jgi:DNA (cytosine-5)-methyltransferase 1